MSNKIWSQENHYVPGLDPVADAFSGTVTSDIVDLGNAHAVTFVIVKGVGATGTSTITVEACDDVAATTTSAVAFSYRKMTTSDTWGANTWVASTGVATTAGSSQRYLIHVDADMIASSGYRYVRLKMVEVVDSPVLGSIDIILHNLRYPRAIQTSQID